MKQINTRRFKMTKFVITSYITGSHGFLKIFLLESSHLIIQRIKFQEKIITTTMKISNNLFV